MSGFTLASLGEAVLGLLRKPVACSAGSLGF